MKATKELFQSEIECYFTIPGEIAQRIYVYYTI